MYVARILYPVKVLGPGVRIGCPRRCEGCSNSELWTFQDKYKTSPETVLSLVEKISAKNKVDGFTITGGDPIFQAEDLLRLLDGMKKISAEGKIFNLANLINAVSAKKISSSTV